MNIYLSTDITDGKKSAKHHDRELVAQSVPESQARALEQAEDRFDAAEHQGKLPLGLRIVQYVAGFCAFILAIGIWRSEVSWSRRSTMPHGCSIFWGLQPQSGVS